MPPPRPDMMASTTRPTTSSFAARPMTAPIIALKSTPVRSTHCRKPTTASSLNDYTFRIRTTAWFARP